MTTPVAKEAAIKKVETVQVDNSKSAYISPYPFADLNPGHGFFVKNEPNQTNEQSLNKMWWHLNCANQFYSTIDYNENGDEVWEDVNIKTVERNPDGTPKLDSEGKPTIGHHPLSRPRYIFMRRYVARAVVKDEDIGNGKHATEDGVVVYRMI